LAPKHNSDVKLDELKRLVKERLIPTLLRAWQERMEPCISVLTNRCPSTVPVVVVAGKTANLAFAQLQLDRCQQSTIDICGFCVVR